jgi:ATP-dependent Clp protease ATP-binding subunit ClpA
LALARGAIRVIGATTIREYRQTIEKDGALERRFQAVRVEEPSADEAVAILLALRPRLEAHHGVTLEDGALRAAVEWSIRYLPDFRLPDKALDLFLQIFDEGTLTDAQGRKCDFRESVIILTSNLGAGERKKAMGFMADETSGRDTRAPVEEAIRRHLRPELVNRLTKVVHFKPLGLETAREVLGKLMQDFNQRLAEKGVKVELAASAEELIRQEGYSEEYGARNLERAVDRLLGPLIAEALFGGKITDGHPLHLEVIDSRLQFAKPTAS